MERTSEVFEVDKSLPTGDDGVQHLHNRNNHELKVKRLLMKKEECRKRLVPKVKIVWAFISFLISVADVTVIIYLSYLHFSHSSDLVAWLMLLPILFNFIGIFTFLSNKAERREMESLGSRRIKNLMFFPVIGPCFGALRLFSYAFEEEDAEKFERLESLLTRMKQYESYFRAAPEAFIQITFRIINWSATQQFHAEDHWTSVCIALCVFTLAESHMYGGLLKYYRMFRYDPTENAWRTDHIHRKWKFALFFFTYFSISSRILADSIQKATACFFFKDSSFGEVIIINFLLQFIFRAGIYAAYNTWMGSPKRKVKLEDEGVYGAFTYSWRSLFMSFDFQSYSKAIFSWFYIENFLMIFTPYIWIYGTPWFGKGEENVLHGKIIFHLYVVSAVLQSILAILIKIGVRYYWKRTQSNKVTTSA